MNTLPLLPRCTFREELANILTHDVASALDFFVVLFYVLPG
jgi:hypothetical protein